MGIHRGAEFFFPLLMALHDRTILIAICLSTKFLSVRKRWLIMSDADHTEGQNEPAGHDRVVGVISMAMLKPKGACWYCNQPLDNIRRFCSRTCADDYRIEEEAFNHPPT